MASDPPVLRARVRRRFCAAASLRRPEWSDERNREVYGVCAGLHGHGHDWILTVEVEGPVDPETGLVMDFARLAALVDERVVAAVDHRHLNHDVDFLTGIVPTAENLVLAFWRRLEPELPVGVRLASLELEEGEGFAVRREVAS